MSHKDHDNNKIYILAGYIQILVAFWFIEVLFGYDWAVRECFPDEDKKKKNLFKMVLK